MDPLARAALAIRVALERGMPVDFFGDYLYNKAHHRRPHDGVLAAWADAMRAPANAPESRVRYLTPPLGASCFSCQTSAISAGRQRLSEGHHALPGPPDGAGLLPMDPAEVPNQLDPR